MAIHSTAKTQIFIGTNTVFNTTTAYGGDTYTEIKEVEDFGEWGAEAAELTVKTVGSGYVRRRKGSIDSGRVELVCARDPMDPGQDAARAAVEVQLPFNFKVVLADKPTSTGTPTTYFFSAIVLAAKNQYGGTDDITKTTFSLGIDGAILVIEASAT